MNVTTTGLNVPGVNAGIFTVAFTCIPITVSDCKPVPPLTWSTVTEFIPVVTMNDAMPPGARSHSVTVVVGVQPLPGVGDGDGLGVGVGVGVGLTITIVP